MSDEILEFLCMKVIPWMLITILTLLIVSVILAIIYRNSDTVNLDLNKWICTKSEDRMVIHHSGNVKFGNSRYFHSPENVCVQYTQIQEKK